MGGRCVLSRCFAMPSAGALCQLLALGLFVETRLAVHRQQPQHDTARRSLDDASFVTVAEAEAIVAEHVDTAAEAAVDRVDATVTKMRSPPHAGRLRAAVDQPGRGAEHAHVHYRPLLLSPAPLKAVFASSLE